MTGFHGHPPDQTEGVPPARAVAGAAAALSRAGIGPARAEAEQLTAYALGVSRGRLALARELDPAQQARLGELVARRARREPLQHLLGSTGFRYLELAVGPGVFVPRPETELLAGWGVRAARLAADRAEGPALVVDLCSGTGAIALAVADEVPAARVIAVERAASALKWLRRNADEWLRRNADEWLRRNADEWLRRNAAERAGGGVRPIEVVAGDVTDPALLAELAGRVDVLLCNPPYVPAGTPVPPEVAEHDPAEAVFGGPDGLAVIRPVIDRAADLLRPGGLVGIEHDESHAGRLPALFRARGRFDAVAEHPDLAGRARFTIARRAGGAPGGTAGGAGGGTAASDAALAWQTGSS
ncbi:peptide chain release factor N(5)-glutamine methyltransferase [Solwaraspora sp. WMMD1047]|uniref:N5-glutamine methyltransferase family protein n=1 Tax=Solwaraspora sp. WMMD1047 TaxID=3016102 RepID=UPI002417A5C4|nr:HemK/PrmC family methyltransferase [Solwaraspora sp. WMMD1047]MDG4828784.1 peptide chain release factor N(5)-glutamine methyltransferase [Solwaraspora sp. WMMD1047]